MLQALAALRAEYYSHGDIKEDHVKEDNVKVVQDADGTLRVVFLDIGLAGGIH